MTIQSTWRLIGLAITLAAGAACALTAGLAGRVYWFAAAAIPIGLLQMAIGMPFWELAARWSQLKSWQRGVLTLATVVGAVAVAIGVGAAVVAANE